MEKIFNDKVALVTGGSFGIGRATAVAFAKRGAHVVVADCVENQETINLVKTESARSVFMKCDVSKNGEVKAMMDKIVATFGRLDFAFNNAGVEGQQGQSHQCTEENWDYTVSVNLKGVWLCMKNEVSHMLNSGKGVIINCASVAGLRESAAIEL